MDVPRLSDVLSNRRVRWQHVLGERWHQLWSRRCVLCASVRDPDGLCAGCRRDLPLCLSACPRCALPDTEGAICGRCLKQPPAFDATTALYRYDYPLDRLVHRLKYGADFAVAHAFAACALRAMPRPAVDLVVPVPLHAERLAERGFNQSLEIARPLARVWQCELATRQVGRTRATQDQVGLPWRERKKNLRNAFSCGVRLDGAHVLLVDDVMTTGATLDALAQCLRGAGAAAVSNLVVARTPMR
ncbi:ComF family protein [Denitromonas sp.]|uniref:ComF family protein n=1 Tax=Denitromonas sp. TaxID=2734609 RepID=UPI002AFFE016|nr:ComF family protein [Denitromonas sp.]